MKKALALLLPLILAGCVQQASLTGLPVYPGSQQQTVNPIIVQALNLQKYEIAAYSSDASVDEILSWYKGLADYEVVEEYPATTITTPEGQISMAGVLMKKGDEGLAVWAINAGQGTIYYLASAPWQDFQKETVSEPVEETQEPEVTQPEQILPPSDIVSGLEPVQRYPGSVMLSHVQTNITGALTIQIDYGTQDAPEQVFDWYVSNLPNEGWQIIEQRAGNEYVINALKGTTYLNVVINQAGYTQIQVSYVEQPA